MEIVVVGAGIVGCAVAYELAARGAQVQVLDERGPGLGATAASAGILAPHIEGHHPLLLQLGLSSLALYDAFVAGVRAVTALPVEYERCGTLQVALNDDEVWDLRERAAALASTGVRHTTLCPRDVRALEPGLSDAVVGALLIPSHGYVNVSSLVLALVRAAGAAGATFSRAHAKAIDPAAAGVRIVTEHGPIDAAAVVLTAGSWLSQLRFGDALLPALVKPVRGQLLHLRLPQRPASRVIWRGPSFYAVPWADGSVLVGATVEDVGFDERHTPEAVSWLREGAAALLPGMAAAVQQDVRVGLRPGTPDGLPLIGPSTAMRNVFYATGHYRNGVLLAPLTAALVADLVLEGRRGPGLEHTRPDRFGL